MIPPRRSIAGLTLAAFTLLGFALASARAVPTVDHCPGDDSQYEKYEVAGVSFQGTPLSLDEVVSATAANLGLPESAATQYTIVSDIDGRVTIQAGNLEIYARHVGSGYSVSGYRYCV